MTILPNTKITPLPSGQDRLEEPRADRVEGLRPSILVAKALSNVEFIGIGLSLEFAVLDSWRNNNPYDAHSSRCTPKRAASGAHGTSCDEVREARDADGRLIVASAPP